MLAKAEGALLEAQHVRACATDLYVPLSEFAFRASDQRSVVIPCRLLSSAPPMSLKIIQLFPYNRA